VYQQYLLVKVTAINAVFFILASTLVVENIASGDILADQNSCVSKISASELFATRV
jgi:fumarate reductase subunit C